MKTKLKFFRQLFLSVLFSITVKLVLANAFPIQLKSPEIFISLCSSKNTQNAEKPNVFDSLHLGKLGLARMAYDYAMVGFYKLKSKGLISNDEILSIIDFTLPSTKKRLFIIDIKNYKLLFVTYVAHGKNTGLDKALYFSNEPESNKSSLGFYTTRATYSGAHGYSLRLDGHEAGFNNNANSRDIVVHSAEYVSEDIAKAQGRIGRSLGCPALSPKINKAVIDKIKNGSCLFVYGQDNKYITDSKFLKQRVSRGE